MTTKLFNKEAEAAVIGTLLVSGDVAYIAAEQLEPADFFWKPYRQVYEAVLSILSNGGVPDLTTVSTELRKLGVEPDGPMLSSTMDYFTVPERLAEYCKMVRDKAVQRKLVKAAGKVVKTAEEDEVDVSTLLGLWETAAVEASAVTSSGLISWEQNMKQTADTINRRHESPNGIVGLATGFQDLDRATGGMFAGDLIVVAGWTSRGKSSLCEQIAMNVAEHGIPVCYFTPEMTAEDLGLRAVARAIKVQSICVRTGRLTHEQRDMAVQSTQDMANLPIYVDDSGTLSVLQVVARARSAKQRFGIGLVIVDYLQLVHAPVFGERKRNQEVAFVSRTLKGLAKDLKIPVILVSQLSRPQHVNSDTEPMPTIFKIKESGDVEADASTVLLVHRPEFHKVEKGIKPQCENAWIVIAKQRHGPAPLRLEVVFDTQKVMFLSKTNSRTPIEFVDVEEEEYLPD
jgi:replicative DNA helicase